jgi:hypothetical protein
MPERIGRIWWAALAGAVAFTVALLLFGVIDANANGGGQAKTTICHPVAAANGGNTHAGYSVITTANPSVHIDEETGAPKHEHDGRVDFVVTDETPCPPAPPAAFDPGAYLNLTCGDPWYGFALDNSGSDVAATFTITYWTPVSHGIYEERTDVLRVMGAREGEWVATAQADFRHAGAGYPLTVVASAEGFDDVVVYDGVGGKSGRVDCPWGGRA